jgi:ketosteroid isomerase-like protein
MAKTRPPSALIQGSADDIETAFYEALQSADIDKLMACWADEDEVACIHPGGPRLLGVVAIRAAFETMFSQSSIRAFPERVHKVDSLTSVVHTVLERIEVLTEGGPANAYVLATNVYHRTGQGWRMVAHHASPGSPEEARDIGEKRPVLH